MTTQYWITGQSAIGSDAADSQSGVVPGWTDGAVITNTDGVTINGTAVLYSLSLDGSRLTVSGSLTLGTSLTVDDDAMADAERGNAVGAIDLIQ